MINKAFVGLASAALILGGISTPATADGGVTCEVLPGLTRQSIAKAEKKAKELGYDVRKTLVTNSCYEVYGVKDGGLYELFYNPYSMRLKVKIRR